MTDDQLKAARKAVEDADGILRATRELAEMRAWVNKGHSIEYPAHVKFGEGSMMFCVPSSLNEQRWQHLNERLQGLIEKMFHEFDGYATKYLEQAYRDLQIQPEEKA